MVKLERKNIEKFSSHGKFAMSSIRVVKQHEYRWMHNFTLTGDAPKEFVRIYRFHAHPLCRKSNPNTWPAYIAKVGHKWYPNESITEYLMNQLGHVFGLTMAESELVIINHQLRFLSKYFLRSGKDQLIHGAEIFAGYLEDEKLVFDIEAQGKARDFFTLQFVEKAVTNRFPQDKDYIMRELVRLVLFDAVVGNNDRHYYNWGIVMPVIGKHKVRFAPIYDTARGLFWNDDDDKVRRRMSAGGNANVQQYIKKYCDGSKPKLGWEGDDNINHFRIVEHIIKNQFYITTQELNEMFAEQVLEDMLQVVDRDFSQRMIPERRELIKSCLTYRFNTIKNLL